MGKEVNGGEKQEDTLRWQEKRGAQTNKDATTIDCRSHIEHVLLVPIIVQCPHPIIRNSL